MARKKSKKKKSRKKSKSEKVKKEVDKIIFKKQDSKNKKSEKKSKKKKSQKKSKAPTLKLVREEDIAMDFAAKVYQKFDKLVKAIVLFGSIAKKTSSPGSDIDIIIIIDDSSVKWDQELIVWYREELGKIIQSNPYKRSLHVNTVKLTTWWDDLLKGDPVVINIIRHGQAMIDFGGFFNPLKVLLIEGRINSTPEAIYTLLQRAPEHVIRSKASELGAIEGVYWAMVDSAHAALIAAREIPPSPEHIPIMLKEKFVDTKMLKMDYVVWYRNLLVLHKKIIHGEIADLEGKIIDDWQDKAEKFIQVIAELVKKIITQGV